ncbi:MAG TPA: hypothetical protein VHE61_09765 [Opitutaceae bacterium]|nr:hypothetical protein [Opitutaceae bacterium]
MISSPRAEAKVRVLRALRKICANLRELQRDPVTVRAYRDVEALLAAEQKQARARARKSA